MDEINIKYQRSRIKSLDGLKVIMLLLIFCWHTPENPSSIIGKPIVDLGARACEVLFIISGFLVGYNHYDNLIPATFKQSWNYVSKKIVKVWPLHLICFLMIFIHEINLEPHDFNISNIFSAITNIFLLQAWTNNPFSFNGATWFLSALLFCYFMSPLLMSIFKKSDRIIMTTFISCIIIRIMLEITNLKGINILMDFHTSPIIRCIEFFIGMMMVRAYFKLKDSKQINTSIIMSILELLISILYTILIIKMEGKWLRGYFLITACILVFVYSFNSGLISKILSMNIFSLFENIQMEFYILHQAVIKILALKVAILSKSVIIQSIILFFITVLLSIIYYHLLKKKMTSLFEKIMNID